MRVSSTTIRRRLIWILLAAIFMFAALIVRLGYLQLWKGRELAERAEDLWLRNIPFAAKRGEIMDRNGERLAYNISSPSVMVVPAQVKDPAKTAKLLAAELGMSENKILATITKAESIVKIQPGGRKISLEKAQRIRELYLPGVYLAEDNKRYYPYGSLAAHVLGFTGIDNQGLTGVELEYDDLLKGINGSVSFLADAGGKKMPHSADAYNRPRDGLNLELTIDKAIQSFMEREMDLAMVRLQPKHIIGIAMNPNNGEILAMSSRPTYEPGNYQEYSPDTYNRNLPIWMTYEPGSTFKIITLAAALEEKKVDLLRDHYYDSGKIEVAGATLHCWKHGGHGSQTFLEVAQNSCNPGFVVLGQRLGKETLLNYIQQFGFGKKTGIDLRGEENGILFKPSRMGPVELATTAFGQGVSVTPIQQITAVSAAINGGYLYKPHVAKAWINPVTGEKIEEKAPQPVRQVISAETSQQMRFALESVVAKGTGRHAFIDGYRVGGKTGTAQKVIGGRYSPNEHIVSFIGFAPADDPQIIIYIAVDDPQGIQFGGLIAAPIVKNIMEDSLRYMGVEPRSNQIDKKYQYGDTRIVEVPDLVGRTIDDIYEDMNSDFLLAKSGSGDLVVSQAPKAGTRVEKGSTIRIFLTREKQNE
ncbi:MAG TPA: stage V sporulation protein D [Bacilli bacterium]